jgi:pantothenate kinase
LKGHFMSIRRSASPKDPQADLLDRVRRIQGGGRKLVAVAGPPASGKSTFAALLCDTLKREGMLAQTVPMDGFHLDNRLLDARGLRARKGAPETFDIQGFVALVQRLKQGGDVVYPVFDRDRDLAVAGADMVTSACAIVGCVDLDRNAPSCYSGAMHCKMVHIWPHARGRAHPRRRE